VSAICNRTYFPCLSDPDIAYPVPGETKGSFVSTVARVLTAEPPLLDPKDVRLNATSTNSIYERLAGEQRSHLPLIAIILAPANHRTEVYPPVLTEA
jgi:hypothetical protein